MKRSLLFVAVLLVLFVLVPIVQAAPVAQEVGDLNGLVTEFAALAGVGGLIAFVINALKYFGVVKDGTINTWATGLNLAMLIVLYGLKVFAPNVSILQLDGLAASLAQIGMIVLGLIVQLGGSKLAHAAVKGTPIIGTSFSLQAVKDTSVTGAGNVIR